MATYKAYRAITSDGREFEVTATSKDEAKAKISLATMNRADVTQIWEVHNV